jgi:anion-transporting  ArsA/GET3 family ATPase
VSPTARAEPDPAGGGVDETDADLGPDEATFGDTDGLGEAHDGGRGRATADGVAATLPDLVSDRAVIVCCGSGGVGKTTVSATFALAAARLGRRSCVVTVDPARRLADALGVESLPNTPTEVKGPWPGRLHALMLDSKGTFDDLVEHYARTPEQAESILANRLYQNLAGALSGTQEYMAMEKLYELVNSREFDIVVVDTPPTRNALDLLDAPRRLTRFLENRLFRALLVPTRMSLRAVGVATQALLRTVAKVAGAEIVQDAVAFFQAFEGMEDGFRTRASAVRELLADPGTAYVLVTSARPDAVAEASFFAEKLNERDVEVAALVVNRLAPSFGGGEGANGAAAVPVQMQVPEPVPVPEPLPVPVPGLEALEANLAELNAVAALEAGAYSGLATQVAPAPVGRIPLFGQDVHELEGLQRAADCLFA